MTISKRDRPPKATRSQQPRKQKPGTDRTHKRTKKDGVVTMAGFAAAFITPALPVKVAMYVTLPVLVFLIFHLYISKPVHSFFVKGIKRYTTLIQALFSIAASASVLVALLHIHVRNA